MASYSPTTLHLLQQIKGDTEDDQRETRALQDDMVRWKKTWNENDKLEKHKKRQRLAMENDSGKIKYEHIKMRWKRLDNMLKTPNDKNDFNSDSYNKKKYNSQTK
eukprot:3759481-Amphidinium_carterae.1